MDKRKHKRVSPIHPYAASEDSDNETAIPPKPVKTNTPPGNVGNDAGGLGVSGDQPAILSPIGPTHEDLADSESKNPLSQNKVTHKHAFSSDPSVSVLIDQFENKDQNRSDVRDNKSEALSVKAPSQGETLDPNVAEFYATRSKTRGEGKYPPEPVDRNQRSQSGYPTPSTARKSSSSRQKYGYPPDTDDYGSPLETSEWEDDDGRTQRGPYSGSVPPWPRPGVVQSPYANNDGYMVQLGAGIGQFRACSNLPSAPVPYVLVPLHFLQPTYHSTR